MTGEEEWWREVCADENKLYTVMKAYKDHRKLVLAGVKSAKSFKLVELKQSMVKEAETEAKARGIMMCKRYFMQWSTAIFALIQTT